LYANYPIANIKLKLEKKMARNIFLLLKVKGSYKVLEENGTQSYNIFRKGRKISVRYGTNGGRYGSETGNCKMLGFTVNDFTPNHIDMIVSFDSGALVEDFYSELQTHPFKFDPYLEFSYYGEGKYPKMQTEPQEIELKMFNSKKELTAALTEALGKDGVKEHNANIEPFNLLNKLFQFVDGTHLCDLESMKQTKSFKHDFLNNKDFIDGVIEAKIEDIKVWKKLLSTL
jgi:hypothetical protein